ncbi:MULTISPECIES: hypothetical protein [Nitrobacteraceae]|uniref:hypothetical protein n=1 Tax=Nitrobacteraceae TaxID=41294 RepID=UPI0001519B52|nr:MULTISPECIES: hypothetical protein [Nitrobacteraceae]ABQ39157.1 hypothetical protein BBta_7288 [Bradyrhizobium sp. BTAi1]
MATIDKLRSGLGHARDHKDISPVLAEIGKLTPIFGRLESMGMTANFVVRLRTTQDVLRRSMLRIFQTQRVEFVSSVTRWSRRRCSRLSP